jgi:hypothetical protein
MNKFYYLPILIMQIVDNWETKNNHNIHTSLFFFNYLNSIRNGLYDILFIQWIEYFITFMRAKKERTISNINLITNSYLNENYSNKKDTLGYALKQWYEQHWLTPLPGQFQHDIHHVLLWRPPSHLHETCLQIFSLFNNSWRIYTPFVIILYIILKMNTINDLVSLWLSWIQGTWYHPIRSIIKNILKNKHIDILDMPVKELQSMIWVNKSPLLFDSLISKKDFFYYCGSIILFCSS